MTPETNMNLSNPKERTAEIIIVGTVAVIRSAVRLEDWRKALSFDPDLGLFDDNDEQLFRVSIEKGPGRLDNSGIVFSEIPEKDGTACHG